VSRIELPDGAWAEFIDVDKITERKRRPMLAVIDAVRQEQTSVGLSEMYDQFLVALIQAWSFGGEPSTETLLDLPIGTLDKLRKVAIPLFQDALPDFGVSPDPKATFGDSPSSEAG
jgi:hypothetical protein